MYASTIKKELANKYMWRHFFSLRAKIGSWVWDVVTVVGAMLGGTYFVAHWFIFLLNHSN